MRSSVYDLWEDHCKARLTELLNILEKHPQKKMDRIFRETIALNKAIIAFCALSKGNSTEQRFLA